MSEPENFLTRWSRRKQEAERTAEKPDVSTQTDDVAKHEADAVSASTPPEQPPVEKKEPEFDFSSLPSIDSIGVGTDVRVFLQKGVPADLTRAALRRAWVTDPTIRDFIEVAENQWDFATGSDIPGFGPLQASDDVRRMVAELFQERLEPATDERSPTDIAVQEPATPQNLQPVTEQAELTNSQPQNLAEVHLQSSDDIVHRKIEISATQQDRQHSEDSLPIRRGHGSALPQ